MFGETSNRCIVLFDGAQTVESIKGFSTGSGLESNPFHGMPPEAIHAMSEHYGVVYQAERKKYRGCTRFLSGKRRCLRRATTEAGV
jgi:hypothetical protein